MLAGLFNRALITRDGVDHFVAAEGYDALGCARPVASLAVPDDHELETMVAQAESSWTPDTVAETSGSGENATGCVEPVAGTDAPEQQLDATQGQTSPTTAPTKQPGDTAQDGFERAVQCAKEGAAIRQEHEARIAKVLQRDSKQATIIQMLNHPQGATIAQICEATGWLPHTVRGTFAGAFKKKLGLTITSSKSQGGVRIYHATI